MDVLFTLLILAAAPAPLAVPDALQEEESGQQAGQPARDQAGEQEDDAQSGRAKGNAVDEAGQPVIELSVEDAVYYALRNNLGLQMEAEATAIARYNARGSWGAFDWVFNSETSWRDAENPTGSPLEGGQEVIKSKTSQFDVDFSKPLTTGGTFGFNFNNFRQDTNSFFSSTGVSTADTITFSLNQPLLRGAWEEYATSTQEIAELDYQSQLERHRQVRQDLILAVSDAYWDLVAGLQQVQVFESNLELGREQLDQNQRRLDAGVGTEVEVLQAETEVATRSEVLLLADVTARDRDDVLKKLIFADSHEDLFGTPLRPTTPLPVDVTGDAAPDWTDALSIARENRTELRQQRQQIQAAELRFLQADSEKKIGMDLGLTGSSTGLGVGGGESSTALQDAAGWDFPTYTASLVINVPIGNRTARFATKAARSSLRSARLFYDDLDMQVIADVRFAVRRVRHTAEAVRAAERSVDLAERQLEAEQARYQEGLSTNFQVLEFQQELTLTRSSETAARANYAKSLVALRNSMGLLGD